MCANQLKVMVLGPDLRYLRRTWGDVGMTMWMRVVSKMQVFFFCCGDQKS
jgi:hypothetical protein